MIVRQHSTALLRIAGGPAHAITAAAGPSRPCPPPCINDERYSSTGSARQFQARHALAQSARFINTRRDRESESVSTTSSKDNNADAAHAVATQQVSRESGIQVFTSVEAFRLWRKSAMRRNLSVGFVPTMGALHEGHLELVRRSLSENTMTVVSIFVNPAQFAPTEDLNSYPRTLPHDVAKLRALATSSTDGQSQRGVAAIFAPTVGEMYPSPDGTPFTQNVADQQGAFVEVHGLQRQMEGASRPTFFRGVATVCTKLFHIVQPDLAYFGQKDIQQAIILRRLVSDLLFPYPPSPQAVRVLPTTRDPKDGLALSSRNTYLTEASRKHAPALYRALQAAQHTWENHDGSVSAVLQAARKSIKASADAASKDGVHLEPLYISLNDPVSLANREETNVSKHPQHIGRRGAILSGAAIIKEGREGRATRLIDNILLGFQLD